MTFTPIAVYFLYFIFSHPDSQLCTPEDRAQDCSSAGLQPICAIYTGDDCHSSTGICYRSLTTACEACLDENVIGFTLGECQQPALPQGCKNKQRGLSCLSEADKGPVCGYGQPHLRGKALATQQFSSGCEACSSKQFMFNVAGECQDRLSLGVCSDHKNKKCEEQQAEPLCAYYTGDDCPDKMCRKTMMNSCNVCREESSVLFFVKGECSDDIIRDGDERVEEMLRDDAPDDQDLPIPELEAVVQEDGTVIYEEVKPEQTGDCYVEPQENIPELEAVLQEDGTFIYKEVTPEVQKEETYEPDCIVEVQENIPELEAVLKEDGTTVYEEVVPNTDPKEEKIIPELEAVVQEDGSIVYEPVQSLNVEELRAEIPVLEAVLQEDGTFTYIDLKAVEKAVEAVETDCYVEPQENIPELEAVLQEDGTFIYKEVKAPEVQEEEIFEPDCVVEVQEYIQELEPVVQEDGSIVYEPVEPAQQPVNEESVIVNEEEKIEQTISNVPVEAIDSRLLSNEPEN